MRRAAAIALVAGITAGTTTLGYTFESATADDEAPTLGPGLVTVEIDMSYSAYSLEEIHVWEGTLVRFEVTNSDPIKHELIVGDEAVHARHTTGHEAFHPPVPGEVSVDPFQTGLTTYLFDEPGRVQYACHLSGHLQYGMEGVVVVEPLPDDEVPATTPPEDDAGFSPTEA
jgi:uncharacterized cupredoxin-like copper-binding protein